MTTESRLVVQRKILGLTQGEAAKRIGISRSSLSQYERGVTEPSDFTWAKIAQVYKMPVGFLRGDDLMIDTCESSEMIFTRQEKKLADDKKLISLAVKKELIKLLREINDRYSAKETSQLLGAFEFVTGKKLYGHSGGKLWVNLNVSPHELSYIKQTMNELAKLAALCRENK